MLRLSKKVDYALMAMKHLAGRPDAASASAREIAEQYDIPVELLAKVLQSLARRVLVTSLQGTRGGYRLARPTAQITVAEIIQAIDGPLTSGDAASLAAGSLAAADVLAPLPPDEHALRTSASIVAPRVAVRMVRMGPPWLLPSAPS